MYHIDIHTYTHTYILLAYIYADMSTKVYIYIYIWTSSFSVASIIIIHVIGDPCIYVFVCDFVLLKITRPRCYPPIWHVL